MTLTTHILTAAAIGKNVDSSWLAACLPFVFHFILDAFRHGEYVSEKSHWSEFWKVAVDFCFGMAILFLLTLASPISDIQAKNIALAVVFSILPDIATLFYYKGKVKFLGWFYYFHTKIIHRFPAGSPERRWNLRNNLGDIFFSLIAIVVFLIFK